MLDCILRLRYKISKMSIQNLTIKSQEILQQAQQLAFSAANANIESEHILKAMLNDKDSPVEFLLKKNNTLTIQDKP